MKPTELEVTQTMPEGLVEQGRRILDILIENPLLALALFIIISGLVILAFVAYKRYFRNQSDRFVSALKRSDPDSVSIVMHDNPDPDAMACALGIERLVQKHGIESTLWYPGEIRHHENRAFRAVLDVDFEALEDIDQLEGEVILVDHHEARGFEDAEDVQPIAIIDHHEHTIDEEAAAEHVHIEPEIGACSTLVTEYLKQQGLSFVEEDGVPDVSPDISTGLLHGIMTDTTNLTVGVDRRDHEAAFVLREAADSEKLHRISNPKIDVESLEARANAIYSREVDGPFAISDIDEVSNTDAIPQAADELVQLEGISAVVVIGENDDTYRLSGRAYDDRVHMGAALRTAVEDMETASAGGHAQMGGGQIPKSALSEAGLTKTELKERIMEALNGVRS